MIRSRLLAVLLLPLALVFTAAANGAPRVYVADYFGTNGVSVEGYDRATDGSLSTLAGSPFTVVTGPPPFPVSGMFGLGFVPDGSVAVSSYLFSGGISSASVANDGSLTPVDAISTASGTGLAVSPDGRFAYVPTRTFGTPAQGVVGFSIGQNGELSELSGSPFGGAVEVGDLAISPDGKYLFASGYGSAVIRRFSIGQDGNLSELLPASPTDGPVMSLVSSPDGSRLFAAQITPPADTVASFSIDSNGSLTENGTPVSVGDVSLGYFDVSPDGRNLYMPEGNSDVIARATVAQDGSLTAAGTTPAPNIEAVGVAPDGRFLYTASDNAGEIGVARIKDDGDLEILAATVPWTSGEAERINFAPGVPPTASFEVTPGRPGEETFFDAGSTQGAARYDWDFGDGTKLADGGPTPAHIYTQPGDYTVTLKTADAQGCSTEQIYTGQSTRCPAGPEAAASSTVRVRAAQAPRVTNLRLNKKKIKPRAKRKAARKAVISYRVSQAGRIVFTVRRKQFGRKAAGKCRKSTAKNKKGKRCVLRLRRIGSIRRAVKAGPNRTVFRGVVVSQKGKKIRLKPGMYRLTAVATNPEGLRSKPASVALRILRGK